MNLLNREMKKKEDRPIRVIQFGEGNFLRGFVDYMLDILNEGTDFNGNIVLIKPIEYGNLDHFKMQDCLYTVSLRGISDGEETVSNRIISSVTDVIDPYKNYQQYEELAKLETLRFVISNTTEAGIVYDDKDSKEFYPPKSYPGKLTKFLYQRYRYFNADPEKGLVILPVELIDDNGIRLKEIVGKLADKWEYEPGFMRWLKESCIFCSTLVDRIITGFPKEEAQKLWQDFGYTDHLIVTGEPFALWVIESEKEIKQELPFEKAGLPVVFTDNQKPYKQRKVRILNGAHTSFSLASYMAGNDYVLSSMEDKDIHNFMTKIIYEEIIPTLTLPREELLAFADAVTERFQNPFIKHALLSISLNSVSKWKARCLPSLLKFEEQFSVLPVCLTFSLAALMEFYTADEIRDGVLIGHRGDQEYSVQDDKEVLEFFAEYSRKDINTFVEKFLSNKNFWDNDLTQIPFLINQVSGNLEEIRTAGIRTAMKKLL